MDKSKTNIKRTTPNNRWFRNVARSLGFTTTELVQELMPSVGEFITENKEYVKDIANDIKDFKRNSSSIKKYFDTNQQFGIAKTALKNAIEDIKTGNIYNKERTEKIFEDEFGMDDFSFDDGDFSFDSSDSGFDDNESNETKEIRPVVKITNVTPSINENSPIVK
ncbi:hypothetical protein, partial [Brevibacillus sp. MCWH]|uniref:hypothetical protein n=1 Tax=Brevibacillus sp. MCWH TaxID=2508871 RepID=UPI00149310F7